MHCSYCGKDNEEGTRVCPWCGTRMSPIAKPRPKRKAAIAAAAVLIIIAACFVIYIDEDEPENRASFIDPNTPGNSDITDTDDGSSVVGDRKISYTTVYNDIFDVTYPVNEKGEQQIVVTLKDDATEGYSVFTWYVNKVTSSGNSRVGNITKTTTQNDDANRVTWTLSDNDAGTYVIGVVCKKNNGWGGFLSFGPWFPWDQTSYTLRFTIDGDITKTYSWEYEGSTYTFSIDYPYSEYGKYEGTAGASMEKREAFADNKGNVDYSVIKDFIVVNDVVDEIQKALKEEYESTGRTASGQGYAEFILAFVQECYGYMYDEVQYAQSEYFAFPMETIYNGYGDCEDTSILLAAIYESAGYDTGVFLIPGHAITAVALDSYVAGDFDTKDSVAVFSVNEDGKTYYGCETTLDENDYGVGYIIDKYSTKGDAIYYDGKKVPDIYGLYTVTASA